jgi:hypothetical protein
MASIVELYLSTIPSDWGWRTVVFYQFQVDYKFTEYDDVRAWCETTRGLLYGTVSNTENFDNLSDYMHNIRTYLDTVHAFAHENINNGSDKQKWYYDYQINFKQAYCQKQ